VWLTAYHKLTLVFDNQDQTRVSTVTTQQLQDTFLDAISNNNNPYNAKLRTLGGDFALNFNVQPSADTLQVTNQPVTPCQNGLWYLFGDVPSQSCGTIPDASASSSSSDKTALADGLVGLFVGSALLMVVVTFIYYKWIAKGQPTDTIKSGMGMELNTMPNDTASAPVAVAPAQLSAVAETSSGDTKSTPPL